VLNRKKIVWQPSRRTESNAVAGVRAIAVSAIVWTAGKVTVANAHPAMTSASLPAVRKYALIMDTAIVDIACSLSSCCLEIDS